MCAYAWAQPSIPAPKTSVSEGEKAAVSYFTQDSAGDVQLGKLGLEKSKNPTVRNFAAVMVRDHTRTLESGLTTARSIGDDVTVKASDDDQIELTRLARYTGSQFDSEYVKSLVDAHEVDIGTAEDALEFASTPAVKTYLQSTLSVDERHLGMARAALSRVRNQ